MTRRFVALTCLMMLALIVTADLATSRPLDPFKAPPVIAFGSGAPASGAHCAALPSGT